MASGAVTSPPLAQQRLPQHVDPTSPPGTIIIDSPRTPPLPSAFSPSTGRSAVRHCTSFSPALRARLDTIAGRARGGTAAEASPTALRRRIRQAMERCSVLDTDQNDSKSVSKKQRLYDAVQRAAASTERTSGAVESSPHGKALSRVLRLRNLIAPPTDGARRFAMTPRADSSGSPVARLGPSARTASSSVGDISPRPGSYLRGKHWTAHMLEKLSQNRLQHGIQDKPQHVIPKSPPATATIPALQEQQYFFDIPLGLNTTKFVGANSPVRYYDDQENENKLVGRTFMFRRTELNRTFAFRRRTSRFLAIVAGLWSNSTCERRLAIWISCQDYLKPLSEKCLPLLR
eukprot:GEMP01030507.1.p1 GENE.GEMP01030507.1~~GEMP01030507.1.p1  ORF type:complete len:393 (+),score=71.22 GEMP01030507.1:143-1180(+)